MNVKTLLLCLAALAVGVGTTIVVSCDLFTGGTIQGELVHGNESWDPTRCYRDEPAMCLASLKRGWRRDRHICDGCFNRWSKYDARCSHGDPLKQCLADRGGLVPCPGCEMSEQIRHWEAMQRESDLGYVQGADGTWYMPDDKVAGAWHGRMFPYQAPTK